MDEVTRIELYNNDDVTYASMHYTDGEHYRCTEEETAVLLPYLERLVQNR